MDGNAIETIGNIIMSYRDLINKIHLPLHENPMKINIKPKIIVFNVDC